ncbi:MAG: methyltransferase [Chloroflexota bacterium]
MMQSTDFWQNFVNKQVTFRFMRQTLRFNLSQSLFGSGDVEVGSQLLLRTIAQEVDLTAVSSVLDIGCGVGVLGLSLKKASPAIRLTAQDRDALALVFTAQNASLNDVDVAVQGGLALQHAAGQTYDLIVSHLPGRVGEPVLQHILRQIPAHLSSAGLAAVVIMKPLAELAAVTLAEMGSEVVYHEAASGYEVFHFRGGNLTPRRGEAEGELTAYARHVAPFKLGDRAVELVTAWNVPEFDSLSHETALALNALKKGGVQGRVLFWNPGQGHVPVFLREQAAEFVLAGRDALSLQIAAHNLRRQGVAETAVSCQHLPHFRETTGKYDWIILFPDVDAGVAWENVLLPQALTLLPPGGKLLMVAKSAYAHRLLQKKRGFQSKFDRKRDGCRAVILSVSG